MPSAKLSLARPAPDTPTERPSRLSAKAIEVREQHATASKVFLNMGKFLLDQCGTTVRMGIIDTRYGREVYHLLLHFSRSLIQGPPPQLQHIYRHHVQHHNCH